MVKHITLVILLCLGFCAKSQTFYADSVMGYMQGLDSQGNPVLLDRSNPLKTLNAPENSDLTSTNINFFSLGFGGYITLKTPSPIPISPLTHLQIFETTFYYQNCSTYPEEAEIFVSNDGQNFTFLGGTCLNERTTFSLYGYVDTLNYIKIEDKSNIQKFSNFTSSDAYDLDGIEIFNLNPLSIELDFFDAKIMGERLIVNFRTLTETGTLMFKIQSSDDCIDFEDLEISFIGANYSTFARNYEGSVIYERKGEVTYVRLKEIDINGDIFYFPPIPIIRRSVNSNPEILYDLSGRRVTQGRFLIKQ
jgi:hypothetical protein